MRNWNVAGGVLEDERGLLLVANQRRGGRIDWTTPGGVVDAGETPVEALRREVREETGLTIEEFHGRIWTVAVEFVDMDMRLEVEVHHASAWSGEIIVADPDGIVVDVEFLSASTVQRRLESSSVWVAEPLMAWLDEPWSDEVGFGYRAFGSDPSNLRTERIS